MKPIFARMAFALFTLLSFGLLAGCADAHEKEAASRMEKAVEAQRGAMQNPANAKAPN